MVGRDVEGLEVELVALHLRALHDDEPELPEDARDLTLGLRQGVQRAAPAWAAGQRDVVALGAQARLEGGRLQAGATLGEGGLDGLTDGVGEGADARSVLRGQGADAGQQRPQLALAPEDGGLDRVERVRRGGRRDGGHGPDLELVELGLERGDVHDGREARRYWDLATSAMRANVAASRTQMSARTLRSSATPADFRPLMSVP